MPNPILISKLVSFKSTHVISKKECNSIFDNGELENLIGPGFIHLQIKENVACHEEGCDCTARIKKIGEKFFAICENHQKELGPQEIEKLYYYECNYREIMDFLCMGVLNQKISDFKSDLGKGLFFGEADRIKFALCVGHYNKESRDVLIGWLHDLKEPGIILFYDSDYSEILDQLSILYHHKLLCCLKLSELSSDLLNNTKRLIQGNLSFNGKLSDFTKDIISENNFFKKYEKDFFGLRENPNAFIGRLRSMQRTEDWKKFEDYCKIGFRSLMDFYLGAGGEDKGEEVPDGFGVLYDDNSAPKRILPTDIKSIKSLRKESVDIPPNSSKKYANYIKLVQELEKKIGNKDCTLTFLAPQFSDKIKKLSKYIKETQPGQYDICFVELEALCLLLYIMNNPSLRGFFDNKFNKNKLLNTLFSFDEYHRFNNSYGILNIEEFYVVERSYIISFESLLNFFRCLAKKDENAKIIYQAIESLSKDGF